MARLRPAEAALQLRSRFTGEERRQELIRFARQAIQEVNQHNAAIVGAPLGYETVVDGRRDTPVEAVQAGGTVVVLWALHLGAVDFTYETLLRLSPRRTGRYERHHVMLVNGEQMGPPPVPIDPMDEVIFVNLAPYARRIEQGWSSQAPDGVYEAATAIVRARYGNLVDVVFGYRRFTGVGLSGEQGRKHGDDALPSILLRPKRR